MSFVTWQYALLLSGVVLLYWQIPQRSRLWLLLGASYLFYGAWDARFLALLVATTVVDFFCAQALAGRRRNLPDVIALASLPLVWLALCAWLAPSSPVSRAGLLAAGVFLFLFPGSYTIAWRTRLGVQRRAFLGLSIGMNLAVLCFFKYFLFFAESAVAGLRALGLEPGWVLPRIILPVGISFYTFQALSYAVDVFRKRAEPESDFLTFAVYISFFPQLVAGPIERAAHLLSQVKRPAPWTLELLHEGAQLLLIGFFKKVFVADQCALVANYAFDHTSALNGPWAVLGVLAFAFQIYGDFSGYTDIARGSACWLGIRLSRNFCFPYFARTPSDFWQRWHVTLSSWFRDYVYIPLGGNRVSPARVVRNIWITMLLAGLWHGANWTFILWGAYHALLLTSYRFVPVLRRLGKVERGGRQLLSIVLMLGWTLVGWAFFRCESMAQLGDWFAALGHWTRPAAAEWTGPALWVAIHALPVCGLQLLTWKERDEAKIGIGPWPVRGLAYAVLFLAIASATSTEQEFIYFQF